MRRGSTDAGTAALVVGGGVRAVSSSSVVGIESARSISRSRDASISSSATSEDAPENASDASALDKIKAWWRNAAKIDKKKIASLGSAALLSYGFVSNVFYVTSLMLATYTAVKTTGASPLVNSLSMKTFASSYFGLWMIQNFLRPARFALSVAISPGTDKIVEFFRRYAPNQDKRWAFAMTVFCINVVGTFAYMFAGFGLIVALTGVPLELSSFGGLLQAAKASRTQEELEQLQSRLRAIESVPSPPSQPPPASPVAPPPAAPSAAP